MAILATHNLQPFVNSKCFTRCQFSLGIMLPVFNSLTRHTRLLTLLMLVNISLTWWREKGRAFNSSPRVPQICLRESPIWPQAIIGTNAWLLSIRPWGTNFSEILIQMQTFSFGKMRLKMSSAKWRPFCPGGDELSETVEYIARKYVGCAVGHEIYMPGSIQKLTFILS